MRVTLTIAVCLLALLGGAFAAPNVINMAYCGFSNTYCGDSFNDDVYSRSNNVLLAYALIAPNGAIILDTDNYPRNQVTNWKNTGKRVFLSVGGPFATWTSVYDSETNRQNFINSLTTTVRTYGLSGVDIDIEGSFLPTPRQVGTLLNDLRKQLNTIGRIFLMLSAEDITIYQGVAVPDADSILGQPFNYLVPIVTLADASIDYYHVKAYSNWYDAYDHASLIYMQDVYLNWRNLQGYC
jgi:chitinase